MKLWNITEYLKEEDFVRDKASPWVGYNNKNLMRELDEDFDGVPSKKYITKDDVRFKKDKLKIKEHRKLKKEMQELGCQ